MQPGAGVVHELLPDVDVGEPWVLDRRKVLQQLVEEVLGEEQTGFMLTLLMLLMLLLFFLFFFLLFQSLRHNAAYYLFASVVEGVLFSF